MQIREILLIDQKSSEAQEPETFFDAEVDFREGTSQAQLPASSTNGLTTTSLGAVPMPSLLLSCSLSACRAAPACSNADQPD